MNGGVLLQNRADGFLYSVAYLFSKITPVKYNNKMYDKKFLAIIQCFKKWKPKLKDTSLPIKILIYHKDLEYFISIKKFIPRQTRWAKFVSK